MKLLDFEQLDPKAVDEILEADRIAQEEEELDSLAKRYEERFEPKSWLEANITKRKKAQVITFLCHVISGAGAAYAFYMLFDILALGWIAATLAVGVIFFHEREKRSWSDKFWDYFYSHKGRINWKALLINASLFLASLGLTVGGAFYGIKDNMPGAEYMGHSDNPEVVALQDQLAEAKANVIAFNADKSNFTSDGKIYYKRLDTKSDLDARVNRLTTTLEEQFGVVQVTNKEIKASWEDRRLFICLVGLLITLIAEIVFEWNMAFRSKFDYRIYLARKAMKAAKSSGSSSTPLPNGQKMNGNGKKVPALV